MPAKPPTLSPLVYLVAITCLVIGAFALLDAWLQAFPAASRALIHPDGGLATALLGLALLLALHGRWRLASVAAAGQLATAAASPWLAAETSMPHAMALMFALLAIGLLLLGHRGSRSLGTCRWLGRGLALVGGLFLLTGWLSGLPEALFTHYHTAGIAALVIISAGLSLTHLAQPDRRLSSLPASRSIAAGVLGALLSVGGWYLFSSQSLQRIDQGGEFAIAQSEATIQRTLAERIRLMHRQAGRWEVLGRLPETPLWQHELESYLEDYPSLGFIALLDDSPATRRLESRQPSIDAAWLDETLTSPVLDGWLIAGQHDRQERLSTLIPGPEGESRILLALPLALPDHPDHWLLTSLDIPTLLGKEIPHTGRYVIQLSQDDNLLFSSGPVNAAHDLRLIGSSVLALPGEVQWTLSVQLPRQQLVQGALLPSGLLLSGLLLTFLLMTSQELYRLSNERRRHLDSNHRALRKVLQQRDQFFTLSLELFCRVSLEGRFLQVNPAFQQQLGYAPEALIGQRYSELIMAEDHELIGTAIQQLAQGERITQLEARVIDAQGEIHWVEINADLGEEEVIYAVARDITQRKQNDMQRLHDQRLFQIAGRTAQIGGWYLDLDDGRPVWSEEVCHIHDEAPGFQPSLEGAIGYYDPDCRPRLREAIEGCISRGEPFDEEFEIVTAKGRQRTVRVIGEAVHNDRGQITRIQGSTQDITDYRRLEHEVSQLAERLTTTLDSITDGFFTLDTQWRFTYLNREAEKMLRHRRDRLLGKNVWEAFPDARGTLFESEYRRALADGVSVTFEEHNPSLDLWVEVHAYPSGEGLAVYFQNINERRAAENQLRILERSVEASVNGVVIADARQPDTPIMYVNAAFEQITGYTRDEMIGRNCRILQGEKTDPATRKAIRQALLAHRKLHVTLLNYRKDGTPFWNDLYISPVHDERGEVTHFIGVQSDISTQREYESKLAFHASHDALTGLPNRTLLEDRLEQSCQFARRYERSLAVLFIDLDEFKPINDTLGHELGDRILVEVARRLEQGVRPGDTVARFGGDEFVVLLPDLAHQDDVLDVTERLLDAIARPYRDDSGELRLTASIGIAMGEGEIRQPTHLIQQADLAMYKAKRQGRNTYQWYTRDLNHKVSERVALRNALQRAIDEQQFELHYQPQVHGATGSILGFEALIRWHHPERGYISPLDFISLAEDTGQIIPISHWVLTTACRDNVYLNGLGLGDFVMAVNVSPMQFHRPNFLDSISQALETSRLPSSLLELELTEGVLMDGSENAIDSLHALRLQGIRIAIDDFGTGFSSLSYLKHLPIDKIKIDRSFVREVISDHRDAAIVQGILSMSSPLQLKVVAEGVETQAQFAFLSKHQCDLFQGFYFARPMPLERLVPFLQDHHVAARDLRPEGHGTVAPTILLVDDEANILRALTRTLRRDGYRLLSAGSAHEAFELLATEEVTLVISDQRMPEMSGTEFLKRVRVLYPHTLQIILSGYTDLKTVTEAVNEGGLYKFLTKPWDDDELRLVVQQAIREFALREARSRRESQPPS